MVAAGSKLEPSQVERTLFTTLDDTAPSTFAVFPVKIDAKAESPRVLVYIDVENGLLNEEAISVARRLTDEMSTALAALVAKGITLPTKA